MSRELESVLLDPRDFNDATGIWTVPMLRLSGLGLDGLYLDEKPIPPTDYTRKGAKIQVSEAAKGTVKTARTAYVVVSFDPVKIKLIDWTKVVVAVLSLLTAIVQSCAPPPPPVGEISFVADRWDYDEDRHEFTLEGDFSNWRDAKWSDYQVFLAVRVKDGSAEYADYPFLSSAYKIEGHVALLAKTDPALSVAFKSGEPLEGAVFLVHRRVRSAPLVQGGRLKEPFTARERSEDDIRLVETVWGDNK